MASHETLTADYLVAFDIASCFEYVEHSTLRQELIVRTLNVSAAEATTALLGEIFGRNRGLPQLLSASDALADAYLKVMARRAR